jgi:hypothetical protein
MTWSELILPHRCYEGTYCFHLQGKTQTSGHHEEEKEQGGLVPKSYSTLHMESRFLRNISDILRHYMASYISEDNFRSHCCENFKSKKEMLSIIILHIVYRPVFYLKHDVSETWFCLRLEMVWTQLSPIGRDSLSLRTSAPTPHRVYNTNQQRPLSSSQ